MTLPNPIQDRRKGERRTTAPTSNTISITLSYGSDNNVQCHLQTNGLPFYEVKRQMQQFVNALQWQIDNETVCPARSIGNDGDEG